MLRRVSLVLILLAGLASPPLRAEPLDFDLEMILAAAPVAEHRSSRPDDINHRLLALSAGALAGVVALNFYMGGLAYLPFTGVVAATPLATAESIVAISRVYAVTSAAAGALVGNWLYERSLQP